MSDKIFSSNVKKTTLVLSVLTLSLVFVAVALGSDAEIGCDDNYSESNRLNYIIDSEFPIDESDIVLNWVYGPMNNVATNSSSVWTLTSTPLIVGNYVYIAVGELLYKLDIKTGSCVKKTDRAFNGPSFYHHLGYGNGVIIDYNDGELFDLDLHKIGRMGPMKASWYENGVFYGLFGSSNNLQLKSFTIIRENGACNIEYGSWTADVTKWFGLYGSMAFPVFTDTHLYYVSATSKSDYELEPGDTFLNSISLVTGEKKTIDLELSGRYLDDGWLTLHNGMIYLPSYTKGLFDYDEGIGSSVTAIAIDDVGNMSKSFSVFFEESGITSNFIIHNGRGYINVNMNAFQTEPSAFLYVFDMTDFNAESEPIYKVQSKYTHGGIVLNSHYEEENGDVYIYIVPYEDGAKPGTPYLYMIHDNPGKTSSSLQRFKEAARGSAAGYNYSSQAVRATDDGYFIWYRDVGQIVCYTSVQNKTYDILLQAGDTAKFVTLTEEQLNSLGNDDIYVSDREIVGYAIGDQVVNDFRLFYYVDTVGWVQTEDSNLNYQAGGAYTKINTSGGCTMNYLILTDGDTPDENTTYYAPDGTWVTIGSFVQDRSLFEIILTKGEPIQDNPVSYGIKMNVLNTASDAVFDITITKEDDSSDLTEARILVISVYENGLCHNVCPEIGPFSDGKTTERVVVSNEGLISVSIEVVGGIPNGEYTSYGHSLYRTGVPTGFKADMYISLIQPSSECYEFESCKEYNIEMISEARIGTPNFRAVDDNGTELNDLQIDISYVNVIRDKLSDGYFHSYWTIRISGHPNTYTVFVDGSLQSFDAKITGGDEEPDYLHYDYSPNNLDCYEFVSGQTYLMEYISSRKPAESMFEGFEITFMDVFNSVYGIVLEHIVEVSDLVIPEDPGDDGKYHTRYSLTITGPTTEENDVQNYKANALTNSEGTLSLVVSVINNDPEP